MERWENEQNNSEMMIYTTEDGLTKIETTFDGDTVWLSIDQMAELFQRDKSTISRHIKNIFAEGELKRLLTAIRFGCPLTRWRSCFSVTNLLFPDISRTFSLRAN